MAFRWIEILTNKDQLDALSRAAEEAGVSETVVAPAGEERLSIRFLTGEIDRQSLLDRCQEILEGQSDWRIVISDTEAVMPKTDEERAFEHENDERRAKEAAGASREEIYERVVDGAALSWDTVVLTAISAVVAGIGLAANDLAIVIGGMLIAPLLGPAIATGFATAIGDKRLVLTSLKTLGLCLLVAVLVPAPIALITEVDATEGQFSVRSHATLNSAVLAVASGMAAALSTAMRSATALVGVMVSVALLPPAAALGMAAAGGSTDAMIGAALLLGVNLVSAILAAIVTFLARGIRPRKWHEREGVAQSQRLTMGGLGAALAVLLVLVWLNS